MARNLQRKEIKFPSLLDLKLSSINVEKIWPDQVVEVSPWIQNLTSLIIEGCRNLSYLFVSAMAKNLVQLKNLEISDCYSIGEILSVAAEGLEEEMVNKVLLPKLYFLKLKCLPRLKRFCTGNLIECPSLKVLWIENCPQLQTFISSYRSTDMEFDNGDGKVSSTLFDGKVSFPKLEELHIIYMHGLRIIWPNELQDIPFSQLKVLKVEHNKELFNIFPSKMLRGFQNLESLVVNNCDLLQELFDLDVLVEVKEADNIEASRLEHLELRNLPNLRHVWNQDPDGTPSFLNLRSVVAYDCPSLRSLFPVSIAKNLLHLEMLNIDACGLEELVEKEEKVDGAPNFVFPQLKSLALWRLEKLRCFYPEQHTLECPVLENLSVYLCDKLKVFASEPQDLQGKDMQREESKPQMQVLQPLFLFEKIILNLEELALNNKDVTEISKGQFPVHLFHKLKVLHLQCFYDAPVGFPFVLLKNLQNLEKLILRCCYLNEPFADVIVCEDAGALTQILDLKLDVFPNMRQILHQDCQDGRFLENLQNLEIWNCHSLISLVPSSTSFRNLITLDVFKCHKLLYLMSSSIANTLVNLTNMSVRESNMVTEILSHERGEIQSQFEIVLSKLESLKLHNLKSLTSFFSSECITLKFPSLKEVVVAQCPMMKFFCEGVHSAPKLKRVYITEGRDKWHWIGDLNTTIKHLYAEMVGLSGIQHLKLSEFSELKEIWHDQLPLNFFHNLSALVVDECAFSSSAVPLNLIPVLNNLGELEVRFCESVEEVFGLEWPIADGQFQYLSKLKKLHLIDLPNLKHIWNELPSGTLDFKNLTVLKIQGCRSLKSIFTPAMCLGLLQLQLIEVINCPLVEEIITKGAARVGTIDMIIFPLLNSVNLQSLLGLRSFYSGRGILHCPSLKEITVVDCPSKFASTLLREPETDAAGIIEQKVVFPNLRDLKLSSVHIEKTWNVRKLEMSSCIQNITSLILNGFGNLEHVLSSSMTKCVVHLKRLEICDCKMMEGVILMEEGLEGEVMSKILLRALEFLKLKDLPKLARFCTNNLIECPALKELWIQNCPELMVFVSDSRSTKAHSEVEMTNYSLFNEKVVFPRLEKMQIFKMDNLKMIWQNEVHSDSFCQMKVLKVESSKELLRIFPSNMLRSLQNLEDLVIRDCGSLEEVYDLSELMSLRVMVANKLRSIDIENLPNLKHVWNEDPLGFLLFDNLNSVYIWNCPSLKVLFPFSLSKGLLQLETLNIDGCGLEEVVTMKAAEENPKFVFPLLKSLDLWRLQELNCFYPGVHTLECPNLQRLHVYNCEKLETFASEFENLPETGFGSELRIQMPQPLFSAQKTIPNLEHLSLTAKDAKRILKGQFPVDLFQKLKVVQINCFHDKYANFPFGLLEPFHKMVKLVIWCSQFNELFPCEGHVGKEIYARILRKIQHLQLHNLPDLKCIWNEGSHLDQVLQSLETLEIVLCDSLVTLAPSSACFQSLTTLYIANCNGLVSLVTSSAAKSLIQLTRMSIKECNGLTEIVVNEGNESKEEVIFNKLEILQLHSLPSLISFCSAEHSLKFPSLLEVIVEQCPNMKFFSKGVLNTTKLECVHLTEQETDEGHWNDNLNATIEQLFTEMVGFSGLQQLELSKYPKLKEMWHGHFSVNFFKLKSLLVDDCPFLSSAVPSNLLPFFNALEELEIRNCESVEEVFHFEMSDVVQCVGYLPNLKKFQLINLPQLRNTWNTVPQVVLHFNNLKLLRVHNCNRLINIFTPTMCLSLVHLQEIEVKSCSMIEEVITEGGAEEAPIDAIIFPLLSFITLESLPRLISFYSGTGNLECPSLTEVAIIDCPILRQPERKAIEIAEPKVAIHKDEKTFSVDVGRILNDQLVLVHLRMLEVCDCKMIEKIITEEGSEEEEAMGKMLLHELGFLKLKNLPLLAQFCTSKFTECPALKEIRIQNCPELSAFVSNSQAGSSKLEMLKSALFDEKVVFPSLEQMLIFNMDNLKMIWHDELHSDSFCKIKVLKMKYCKKLLKNFPSKLPRILQNLEDLVIRNCDSLEEVFELQEVLNLKETITYQLRTLDIRNLPNLKHVWNEDPEELLFFDNLTLLYIWNCPSLKYLFPKSIAGGLPQLEILNIDNCGMEELVAKQKGAQGNPKFVFPRLKSLDLWRLEELGCFYPGIHTLECPVLERLHVYNCERLEVFASKSKKLQETHLDSQHEILIPQWLFPVEIILKLEHLSLREKDAKIIIADQYPADLFQKLKSIQLNCFHDESTAFPYDLLQAFRNIEKLVVGCSQFKVLFPDEGLVHEDKLEWTLSQLRYLELDLLPDLKHIWKQHPQLDKVLQILESLIVQQCDSLTNLAPSSASFRSLRTLDVMNCNGLLSLMTSSTAKTLVQLTRMSIKECNTLTELVANEGEESKQEIIIFSKLETLGLHCLPSLVTFCSAEYTLKFPSLVEITVRQCPKMQVFSNGVLFAPKLQAWQGTEEDKEAILVSPYNSC
ncbi:uncharacterized protein [Euphorbia lathyris]|uniref:uncharacterized protein isoform X2 n=1 Tax=Euphorbia lathyris TaxID=212925 RepID=UPI003314499B